MYRIKKMLHSIGPGFLAVMIICGMMLPHVSVTTVLADTDSVLAWGSDWHYYCIDGKVKLFRALGERKVMEMNLLIRKARNHDKAAFQQLMECILYQ